MDSPSTRMAEMYVVLHGFKSFFHHQPELDDSPSDEEIFETAKEIFNQLVNMEYPVNLEEERRSLKGNWLRIINDRKPVKENLFDGFIRAFGKALDKTFPLPDSQTFSVSSGASSGRTRAEKFALMKSAQRATRNRVVLVENEIRKILNS